MGKKKAQRSSETSSGKRRTCRIKRNIRRTKLKIKRWEKYAADEVKVSKNNKNRSRFNWDTSKMEKHVQHLTALLK